MQKHNRLTVLIDDAMQADLKRLAYETDVRVSFHVRMAITDYITKHMTEKSPVAAPTTTGHGGGNDSANLDQTYKSNH